jgi:hypothetical protein
MLFTLLVHYFAFFKDLWSGHFYNQLLLLLFCPLLNVGIKLE